jgi:hypothetical protein
MRACVSPVDGLLRKQGRDQSSWDARAARAYLSAHDDLLRCFMVLIQVDWGQACRISELLTLECCNTASRLRGICNYGARPRPKMVVQKSWHGLTCFALTFFRPNGIEGLNVP